MDVGVGSTELEHDLNAAESALVEMYPSRDGSGNLQFHKVGERRGPYSRVRVIEVESQTSDAVRYYIKRVVPPGGRVEESRSRLVREGRLLKTLERDLPGEVVRVLAVWPENLAIVTEECRGRPLNILLRFGLARRFVPGRNQGFVEAAERCGRWLRKFQRATESVGEEQAAWIDFTVGEADWRVEALSRADAPRAQLYEEVGRRFEAELRAAPWPMPYCLTHGDFAPHNIFVTDSGVQVLDFYEARPGHPAADVVNFVASLAGPCEGKLGSRSLARALCDAFAKGYGGIGQAELPVFRCLLVLQSLKRLLVLHRMGRGRLARWPVFAGQGRIWHREYLLRYVAGENRGCRGPWPFWNLSRLMGLQPHS